MKLAIIRNDYEDDWADSIQQLSKTRERVYGKIV